MSPAPLSSDPRPMIRTRCVPDFAPASANSTDTSIRIRLSVVAVRANLLRKQDRPHRFKRFQMSFASPAGRRAFIVPPMKHGACSAQAVEHRWCTNPINIQVRSIFTCLVLRISKSRTRNFIFIALRSLLRIESRPRRRPGCARAAKEGHCRLALVLHETNRDRQMRLNILLGRLISRNQAAQLPTWRINVARTPGLCV